MKNETMNFAVYSKDGCPYCTKVVQVLELAKLNHVIYKLDQNFDRKSFYGEFGEGSTFPQVTLNGRKKKYGMPLENYRKNNG